MSSKLKNRMALLAAMTGVIIIVTFTQPAARATASCNLIADRLKPVCEFAPGVFNESCGSSNQGMSCGLTAKPMNSINAVQWNTVCAQGGGTGNASISNPAWTCLGVH